MGEKFAANPVTGSGLMSVPIATSPGRSGFGPELSLSYDSGAGNGPFGFGWTLSLPSITRKTDKGLPQYRDAEDSDVFILSGAEDLVPVYRQDPDGTWVASHPGFQRDAEGGWVRDPSNRLVVHEDELDGYQVRRYRPRIEGLFARIERWNKLDAPGDVHWRSSSKDNILTLYGLDVNSRIADPLDASRIFRWLICETRDDKGNAVLYRYKAEDGLGVDLGNAHERNRGPQNDARRTANRYPKRIHYGNRTSLLDNMGERPRFLNKGAIDTQIGNADWMFEVVFDYDDHEPTVPKPSDDQATDATGALTYPWKRRSDPFSAYRAGFEVRTTRLCQRVLVFHHFPGEAGVERDCLVRSTDFTYSDKVDPTDVRNPVYTFLRKVTQSGYHRNNGGYAKRSLPPVEFEYTEPTVQDTVEEVDPQSLENLPIGLDGTLYQWTDLHGEGVPGILTEQAGAWFYKRNLSPIPQTLADGREQVKARFSPLETVALKPNIALASGAEFMDLAGDGQPDLVMLEGPLPGLYEHDGKEGWQPFRPFTSRLNRDFGDPNLKFIDLDGDGHADVLITEDDAFVWHASLTEAGFGPARRVAQALDEEKGPRIVFADGTQSIYLADLSGDGLTDIARIRNGEVCYWPNLGYGRFGAKVAMDHAPWFDNLDQFDHKRLRLADIDGSGTSDIIYLHRDGVRLYFNQSGNSWSHPQVLKAFPHIDDLVSIMPTDLLGNGTACLVWSSPLPGDARRPLRYVNLMGGRKPHLLVKTINNLGAKTRIEYVPSTKFYLRDKRDGIPWITRLPFPVHVVERVETFDHLSRNRFVTRYAYHHGYFDGEEREFRGFGMVEQSDTEQLGALTASGAVPQGDNFADESHVPPVHTKTWFHTGVHFGRDHVSDYFAGLLNATDQGEYFRAPGLTDADARALLLPDTVLPVGLALDEEHEACRALKGMMLRQEVYADDAGQGASAEQIQRARTPYTVTEQNFSIRVLQQRGTNRHAVFFTHVREAISYHYERNPADPRIQHALTLEVDGYGNVLKQAAIGYGRRGSPLSTAWDRDRQTTPLLTYTENRVTNAVAEAGAYRTPLPCEAVTFELTSYTPTGAAGRYQGSDFVEPDPAAPGRLRHTFTDQVAYEAAATGNPCRRPIEWLRTLYRRDDLSGLLPLGNLHPLGLPGESYKLAFTPGLLAQVFQRPLAVQLAEPLLPDPAAVLGGQGGYLQSQTLKADGRFPASDADDHWWLPSGQSYSTEDPAAPPAAELAQARQHFFLPRRFRDPFGQDAFVDFDSNDLLMVETRDVLDNRVTVDANDYRFLQPRLVSDPNRNQTEVAFDTLGMVVGTAVMGKPLPAPVEGDSLSGFVAELTQAEIDGFFDAADDPHTIAPALLQGATTRIVYDLDRFRRTRQANPNDPSQWQPPCAATLARETHLSAPLPPQGLKIQLSFSYSDGFGREIQQKIQAEPKKVNGVAGPPRWVGSGWTIFNNKGKPVRQYEPFFSATHRFEFGVMVGVSPVLFYDPAERVVATLHPNHTFEKVVFDPWQQTTWDVNDTCAARNAQTGDPRTDPDIGGYVAAYFESQLDDWQTWHAQRIGGALGQDDRNAALRAAAHADTPITAHSDALGRPFLTIAHNRVVCAGHDLDGSEARFTTRVELDIEGNERAVVDHLGRDVMRYDYDLLSTASHTVSMDAGERWMLGDVAGNPIRAWDSRGHAFRTTYDELRRPLEAFVAGTDSQNPAAELLFQATIYGESMADAAQGLNLRGRAAIQFDAAGVVVSAAENPDTNMVEAYDFKGNLLRSTRRLAREYKQTVDWDAANWNTVEAALAAGPFVPDDVLASLAPLLEPQAFSASTTFDALDRPISLTMPEASEILPTYNEANLLEQVAVRLRSATTTTPFVNDIDYDAKGQRKRIEYGNGVVTEYEYDEETLRLIHLKTTRQTGVNPLQNLRYTYDPAGNIARIRDDAQQTIYFDNAIVEPHADYTYDALYRLIRAEGRENIGQTSNNLPENHPQKKPHYDFNDSTRRNLPHPNDGQAMRAYTELYEYDAVGNILTMIHHANGGSWTRHYAYAVDSNRVLSTSLPGDSEEGPYSAKYEYDVHGNIVRMPHLPLMEWNFRDQLQATSQQVVNNGGTPEITYYFYDSAGQRARKVTERQAAAGQPPTRMRERIYLGGFEVYREYESDGETMKLEREALHIMDDMQRVALVETRTQGTDPAPRHLVRFQIGNHLGSASLELDTEAQIISYEEYYPYGSTSYQAVRNHAETPNRYRYTGMERDEESSFSYHGARFYAQWLGRWISADPSGLKGGINLYAYAYGNPTIYTDRGGTNPKEFLPGLITDYPLLGQAWDDAAQSHLEYRYGKENLAANKKAFHAALDKLPEGPKRSALAREVFDSVRKGFYRRVGRLYEQGLKVLGGIDIPQDTIKKMIKSGTNPAPSVQIDHAIDELAKTPHNALEATNLGIRMGHAGVPGGSHNTATVGRLRLALGRAGMKGMSSLGKFGRRSAGKLGHGVNILKPDIISVATTLSKAWSKYEIEQTNIKLNHLHAELLLQKAEMYFDTGIQLISLDKKSEDFEALYFVHSLIADEMRPVFSSKENKEKFFKEVREYANAHPGNYRVYVFDEGYVDRDAVERIGDVSHYRSK
ncbi:SpvB/TcaC N-terminal domain-containing protein [Halomonas korlensis]|nr:SpvB/TcaC N-terminal domain-containing protein [Halomonas korlensis]